MSAYPGGDAARLLRSIDAQQALGRIGSILFLLAPRSRSNPRTESSLRGSRLRGARGERVAERPYQEAGE